MTNLYPKSCLGFLFLLLNFSMYSQGPGCPNVDAGPDVVVTCADPCVTLTAEYLETGDTSEYTVSSIPYAPPFPFTGGSGATNITQDDRWSEPIQLPFDFCFFGDSYSRLLISSNGSITFSIAGEISNGRYSPETNAGYQIRGQVPGNDNSTSDARAVLGIMGVLQDTDPRFSFSGWSINYEVIGSRPCRMLVFNVYKLGLYSCHTSQGEQTYQMILYETTNAIDVFVSSRTPCNTFESGRGVIGIQNEDGSLGYTPPGRNTGNWSASNEAWRFTPSGASNVDFMWLDEDGNVVGTDRNLTICVTGTTTFTAQAEYTNCDGITITDSDTVTVIMDTELEVDLGEDVETCEEEDIVLFADTGGATGLTYEWFWDGVLIPGATTNTYTVSSPDSGAYKVKASSAICEVTDTVNILFNPQPIIANPAEDLGICDDGSSSGLFDLTQNNSVVRGTQDASFVITYHKTQAAAIAGTPVINPANAYPIVGTSEIIWVRIRNANNTCYAIDSFEISMVTALATAPDSPYKICDEGSDGEETLDLIALFGADILGGQSPTQVALTFHDNATDADSGANDLPIPYVVTTSPMTIYARVENRLDPDCYAVVDFQIIIEPQPFIASPAEDMGICDDGTSSGLFDLTQNDAVVLGTQDPNFVISYHRTQANAEAGTPQINPANAYAIVGNVETIWVRIENENSSCYAIDSFEISLVSAFATAPPSPYYVCDQDNNGEELINLQAVFGTDILNGQNPNQLNLTFHDNLADANSGDNELSQPYAVTTTQITIYARVESRLDADCFAVTQFEIIMELPPDVNPTPLDLIVCDSDNDGYAFFNLHDADENITLGDATMIVTYHPTELDAQNDLNELTDPYENDDPYNDVVFARVEGLSGCNAIIRLNLVVRNSPMLVTPTPLRLCDDNTDGFQIFNLPIKEPQMLGSMDPLQYDFYYYEVEADAIAAGQAALENPDFSGAIGNPAGYQNTVPFQQTIYVLAVGNATNTSPYNGGEGCYDIVPLVLFVDPLPVPIQPLPYELCDDLASGSDTDQISTFNLTTRNAEITGGDPRLSVLWFETYADEAANNPILNPRAYQNREIPPAPLNPMTIVARVTNNFGCSTTITLTLVVNSLPVPAVPTPLEVCDGDNNGFAQFDLTEKDAEITNGEPDVTIRYYTTRALAEVGSNADQILGLFTNDNPFFDTVWARVEKDRTGCYAIVPLELIVNPTPGVPAPGFGNLIACDPDGSASAEFDLTQNSPYVYGSQSPDFIITYHTSLEDAEEPRDAIADPASYSSTGQTIWVRLENNETGCFRVSSFELIVGGMPTIVAPQDMALCDDLASGSDTDGVSIFNLTLNNSTITGGNTNLTVRYYETVADQENDNPIANPRTYRNPLDVNGEGTTPHTIQVSVFGANGCSATTTLTLVVLPVPRAITPTPLVVCDDDNDGFAEFDLTQKNVEIANGEPNLTIRYYTTRILAEAGDAATQIVGPYTNDSPFNDRVWARIEKNATGCYVIRELALVVSPIPDAPTAGFGDLVACDPDGGSSAVFDLTQNAPFIYGTQSPDLVLTYHTSLEDAEEPSDAITDPTEFASTGQTIWVRLENEASGCFRISSFDLIVGEFPIIVAPQDMVLCDDLESGSNTDGVSIFNLTGNNNTITNGNSSYTVRYYETVADQESDNPITSPEAYTNPLDGTGQGTSPHTLQVSVFSSEGCEARTTITLVVLPVPRAIAPEPLVLCDDDNDGFGLFELTQKDAEISNGNPAVVVTYHETLLDANNGTLPLASPFQNIVAFSQTIYARVTFGLPPNVSGCYAVVPLELIVAPSPEVPIELPDLVLCDPDGDGVTVFDLTVQEELIYGDQDPTQLRLTYHLTQDDANTGLNRIVNPGAYTNISNPQFIYVRLAYIGGDQCYGTGSFKLIVSDGIAINTPTPLEQCDDLGEPNDMRTTFNLTLKNAEITGGAPGLGVSYFVTEQDAMDNVNRIDPDYAFENTENPQRVYVRVIDGNSGCVSYTNLLLRVLPNPQPVTPAPLILCDENIVIGPGPDDGVEVFDLTQRAAQIRNGSNWELGYFETYADALANENAIDTPDAYENTSSPQIIYVRVTNAGSQCFEIVELELIVNPLPDATAVISPYIKCEFGTDISIFDLTTKIPEILGGNQSPLDFEIAFYLDPIDAENGTNKIVNVTQHQNRDLFGNPENPQTIYVGIKYVGSECYIGGVQSFELIVQEGALATTPAEPFIICDNVMPSDGFAEFDLEDFSNQQVVDLRNEILTGQDPDIYSLAFYETMETAIAGTQPIVFPFVNTINPQVIYARVTNEDNIHEPRCYEIVEVILKVRELPILDFDDQYRLCVDANGNPIAEEGGSMSPPVIDTGLDPALYTFEWMHDGVLLPNGNGPSIIAMQAGEYTVTVTEIESGCQAWGTATVVLSSPPLTYSATETTMAFSDNHTIEVTAEGLGVYEYQLDNGPFQASPIFENIAPGTHTMTIRDVNGCGSVTIDVSIIDYPPFFTPNGDGYHDTWNIIGIEFADPYAKVYIFDRYGKLLKQLSTSSSGWDGTYNGKPMPSSDYWFRVDYTEDGVSKQKKGHFTLKR